MVFKAIHFTHVADWVASLRFVRSVRLSTTPITELGFVRILSQASPYGLTISDAKDLMDRLKATSPIEFSFIADGNDISKLPDWVKLSKQTTDGHLAGSLSQTERSSQHLTATSRIRF